MNDEQQAWAAPLKELLLEIKAAVEQAREAGEKQLMTQAQARLSDRYDELVGQGLWLNPPLAGRAAPTAAADEAGEKVGCQKQAHNLLRRLERRKAEALRFMTDFGGPFENNQAERDLRMVKLQQKVSGCFRSEEGARRFCRIRGYISTMRKQGRGVLGALEGACRGKPLNVRKRPG